MISAAPMPPTEYTRWSHARSPKTNRTNLTHVRLRARWTVPFHLLLAWRPNGRAAMASWAGVARCGTTHPRWRVRRAHRLIRSIGRRFEAESDDEKAVQVCRLSRQQLQAPPRLRRSQGRKKRGITLDLFSSRTSHHQGAFHKRRTLVLRVFFA